MEDGGVVMVHLPVCSYNLILLCVDNICSYKWRKGFQQSWTFEFKIFSLLFMIWKCYIYVNFMIHMILYDILFYDFYLC